MKKENYKGYNNPFATNLRELMQQHGTKQTELSELLGVTRQSIGQYADGTSLPPVDKIIELANYYNVSADYILGLTDITSNDADLRSVCEYTGLSEKSIENIQNLMGGLGSVSMDIDSDFPTYIYQYNGINILNTILEKFDFNKLISFVGHSACQKKEMSSKKLSRKQQYNSAISYNASRYVLNKLFEELMDNVIDELEVEYHGNNSEEE